MTISALTVFQIQNTATASNVNAGGFNPSNVNFLTDGAATSATSNSPIFTSASYNFIAGDVGAWIFIKSGTNWTSGYYQIASVSANAATLSAAIGQGIQVNNNIYSTQTVAGVATTASSTSATWGIDYSQSDAARYTATDLTGATTTCTSVTNPFTAQMVGNLIHLNSGTGVTAGWYEIVSVSTGTATLDRSAGTTYSVVTYHTGGALSLGSSDDDVFELGASSGSGSTRFFIKGGSNITYTLGGVVSISLAGNDLFPIFIEGYFSTRGDRPKGSTRPIFACGANTFTLNTNFAIISLSWTGNSANLVNTGSQNISLYSKYMNNSTTMNRTAMTDGGNSRYKENEFICYRGIAFTTASAASTLNSCYIHDSVTGVTVTSNSLNLSNNIFIGCSTRSINNSANNPSLLILNNTFYGAENNLGIGVGFSSTNYNITFENNILYGFVTGVNDAAAINVSTYSDYNDYFNNTTDIASLASWQKGPNDIAVNPQFVNISQVTGTTATSVATTLTDSSKNFTTAGVVAGRDYLQIISGTGATAGIYGITAVGTTTLTVDLSMGTSSAGNLVYQITIGRNLAVGTNLKAKGYPGVFPGGLTTGYIDIGAAQRQESTGGSGGSFTFS